MCTTLSNVISLILEHKTWKKDRNLCVLFTILLTSNIHVIDIMAPFQLGYEMHAGKKIKKSIKSVQLNFNGV